ncbi:MAG: sugar ABC transporter substrate-binding protein [Rhizobacter sp.]
MKHLKWWRSAACGLGLVGASLGAWAEDVSFWARASDAGFVEPLVKAWNAGHASQVALTVIPNDDFVTKLGTSIAGGSPPDVVAIDLIFVPAFAEAGQFTDISSEARALPFFKSLSPSHLRLAESKGKQYAVPFSAEGSVLLYNKKLFAQAGLNPEQPPQTLAEIEAAAKKITALGKGIKGFYFSGACGGCNIFTLTPYIWASGGDVLSADGKRETLDNPALKNVLATYRRMWQQGSIPSGAKTDSGANFINAFLTGKVGMVGSGAFSIGLLKKEHPEIDFGLSYLPGDKSGAWSSFAGGDSIAIPTGSKRKQEAWEFIAWCLSEAVQVEQFAKNGSIPVREDLANNAYSQLDKRYVVASAAMAHGKTPYATQFNQLFNDPNGPWLAMLQEAVFGKGVDAAVKEAQPRFRKVLGQ